MVVFTLVLQGCPRKVLAFQSVCKVVREKCCFLWFYKVVREKCCFYIGFTRLSAKKVVFTLVLEGLSAKNVKNPVRKQDFSWTTRPAWFRHRAEQRRTENRLTTALASQSNRLSLAHTASPRLARSHARTKRNDFPVGGFTKGLTPPNLQYLHIHAYTYTYILEVGGVSPL